jgi:hypothetical protein
MDRTSLTVSIELDKVVGFERLPSWEDHASLPYLRGLIKELHRCCGIVALGTYQRRYLKITVKDQWCNFFFLFFRF